METFQTDNYIYACFRILAEPGKLYLVETKDTHPPTTGLSVLNPKLPKKHAIAFRKKKAKKKLDGQNGFNDYARKPL